MATLTLKGIPRPVLDNLRKLADEQRRSMNQQAIQILEDALRYPRPRFTALQEAFLEKHGPSPLVEEDFEGLESREVGGPSPFEDE